MPTRLTFVDIAGLVRGASKGEGLGNQFLAHIREVDAVAYVLRCFEDPDVVHVEGRVDPIEDADTIETELMLADLDSLERRLPILEKKIRGQEKEAKQTLELVERVLCASLRDGKPRAARRNRAIEERALSGRSVCSPQSPCSMSRMSDEAPAATGNALFRARRRARARGGRGMRRHLGQDRGRAGRLVSRGAQRLSRRRSGSPSQA